jgi:competence protein ComEC
LGDKNILKIHFLNVGKGNCTIIEFPSDRLTIVDIDNSKVETDRQLTNPIEYVQTNFKGKSIFRFILTHPDMDHMSGLCELSNKFTMLNFWDTTHNKNTDNDDWDSCPYKKEDWEKYLLLRQCEDSPKCLRLHRGDSSEFWKDDGIEILSPSINLEKHADATSEYNHLSYVLKINYKGFKILLGGDATPEAWEEILNTCGKDALKADVFLAPHHGSKNNIHDDAFKAIAPQYVIISVAKGIDYDYDYYFNLTNGNVKSTKHFGTMRLELPDTGNGTLYYEKE